MNFCVFYDAPKFCFVWCCLFMGLKFLCFFYKCVDPYLNTDAGTMSPFEHGEVFVLDDGGEVKFFCYSVCIPFFRFCNSYALFKV